MSCTPSTRTGASWSITAGPTKEMKLTTDQVNTLLEKISGYGFFTDEFYATHHQPCRDCSSTPRQ